jgi:hypothetical protein
MSYIGQCPFSPMYLRYIKLRSLDQILFTGCKGREGPSHQDALERVSLDKSALSGGSTGQREICSKFFVQYITLCHKRLEKYLQRAITYQRDIGSHEQISRRRSFAEEVTLKICSFHRTKRSIWMCRRVAIRSSVNSNLRTRTSGNLQLLKLG